MHGQSLRAAGMHLQMKVARAQPGSDEPASHPHHLSYGPCAAPWEPGQGRGGRGRASLARSVMNEGSKRAK